MTYAEFTFQQLLMSNNQEIVPSTSSPLSLTPQQEFSKAVMDRLSELGMDSNWISETLISLINDSFIKTNSGETYRDNKTVLETIKLILSMNWIKWASNQPQIAIFNNMPQPNKPLEY